MGLNSLGAQKEVLSCEVEKVYVFATLPKLSLQSLEIVKDYDELSDSEIASLSKANLNKIKKRLADLIHDKYLLKQGQREGNTVSAWNKITRTQKRLSKKNLESLYIRWLAD